MYGLKSMYDPEFERMMEATALLDVPFNKVLKVIDEVTELRSSEEYVFVNFEMPLTGREKGENVVLRITPSSIANLDSRGMPEDVRKAALALQTKFELKSLVGDLTKSRERAGLGELFSLFDKARRAKAGADAGPGTIKTKKV